MTSETVYVRGQSMGNGGFVLHTDRDCSHLHNANAVLEHPRDAYPDDQPVCEFCAGEFESAGGDNSGPWETLQEMAPDGLVTDGGQDIGQSVDATDHFDEVEIDLILSALMEKYSQTHGDGEDDLAKRYRELLEKFRAEEADRDD